MSFGFRKLYNGINIVPQNTTAVSVAGDVRYNSSNNQFEVYNTGVDTIATANNTLTLTNKTLTTPVIASITSGSGTFTLNTTGTITVPNGTDTLVGLALTQTLTNKVLTGNTAVNLVSGSGTFVLNTTGTITAPNGTDTLAGISLTQSITNKTLGSTNTATGINMASFTPDAGAHTLTAPTVTDTLTANAATQTLTNKTLGSTNTATGINMASFTPDSGTHTLTAPTVTDTLTANAATQTLTNKTFGDAATFTEISTPSNPTTGQLKLYPKSNNSFYTLSSTGVETLVGSAGGGNTPFTKNYISNIVTSNGTNSGNSGFEDGTTTGWSLGHTALSGGKLPTGTPTFGSGASGNLSFTVGSDVLSGNYSGNYFSSTTSVAGDLLASSTFFIDLTDQNKLLNFQFSYQSLLSSANVNFSGTSNNTFGVAIYDVTNSAWIVPSNSFAMVKNTGTAYCGGTFQTTSNSTQYRFVIYNANASTGTFSLAVDDFYVGPLAANSGVATTINIPNVTSPVAYTPTITGFGTVAGVNFTSYQVGAYLVVDGTFTCGTPTAVTAKISFGFNGTDQNVTSVSTLPAGGSNGGTFIGGPPGSTFFNTATVLNLPSVSYVELSANNSTNNASASNGNVFASSANVMSVHFVVPIQGWTANTSLNVLGGGGFVQPTIQKFTSGSGTYTTPANVSYIRVRAVGGGGGGLGNGGVSSGTNGGNTTFGTSLITVNGGTNGGAGGSATANAPCIGTVIAGATGGGYGLNQTSGSSEMAGGAGAASPWGGQGGGGSAGARGGDATGYGSGGGGGGSSNTTNNSSGNGGGAGGYVDVIIPNPSATYSYAVGVQGTGGAGGTSTGGNGTAGYIEVTEYYYNGAIGTATTVTQPQTNNYYSGYFTGASGYWSIASAAFGDPTASGTPSLVSRVFNGITVSAAASSLAGITFTPASATAVYLITANSNLDPNGGSNTAYARLTDGTNVICSSTVVSGTSGGVLTSFSASGIYAPGTASPVTVKLQLASNSNSTTVYLGNNTSGAASIEWTIVRLF